MIPNFPNYVFINDQSLSRKMMSNVARSEMSIGPQKTRPMASVPMFQASAEISVHNSKYTEFRTWFQSEIKFGADWFLMNDPFDGTQRRFRFVEYDGEWTKTGNLMRTSIVLEAYDEL